jgi:hypothetical protein
MSRPRCTGRSHCNVTADELFGNETVTREGYPLVVPAARASVARINGKRAIAVARLAFSGTQVDCDATIALGRNGAGHRVSHEAKNATHQ